LEFIEGKLFKLYYNIFIGTVLSGNVINISLLDVGTDGWGAHSVNLVT